MSGVPIKAVRVVRAADGDPTAPPPHDSVTLAYDDRFRRRRALATDGGESFLLALPTATVLRQGDRLLLDDGRTLEVRAADEPVADLAAQSEAHLVRLAWHLGNRHLPTQILATEPPKLRIRRDHVIEEMAVALGATVTQTAAPFDPEGGAYGDGASHSHGHGHHGHDHDRHAQGRSDAPEPEMDADPRAP